MNMLKLFPVLLFMGFTVSGFAVDYNSNATISSSGTINGMVINNGAIVTVNANITVNAAIVINDGRLIINSPYTITHNSGGIDVKNDGILTINSGATLTTNQDFVNDGGLVSVNGTFNTTGSGKKVENKSGGSLDGSGSLNYIGSTNLTNEGSKNSNFFGYDGNNPKGSGGPCSGGTCSNAALPVELLSFTLMNDNSMAVLHWVTATEINNDFFTIERSAEGVNFTEIAKIKGAGNSVQTLEYKYEDAFPLEGVSYYRLRQTDLDGTSVLYDIVPFQLKNASDRIRMFPNPTGGDLTIMIDSEIEQIFTLYDLKGQLIMKKSLSSGKNTLDFDDLGLSGMFIGYVLSGSGQRIASEKIIIR